MKVILLMLCILPVLCRSPSESGSNLAADSTSFPRSKLPFVLRPMPFATSLATALREQMSQAVRLYPGYRRPEPQTPKKNDTRRADKGA